jgi:chemotaxis protein CheD
MEDTGKNVIRVMMAEYRIMKAPGRMMTMALGSCLGIVLYDRKAELGALAHVMHPSRNKVKNNNSKGKFVDTAVEVMVSELIKEGGSTDRLTAKIFGGATMFDSKPNCRGVIQIGELNINAAREALAERQIPILSESVGGKRGRTIVFDLTDGSVLVRDITGNEKVM